MRYPGASRALWLIHDLESDTVIEDQGTALKLLRSHREAEPRPVPRALVRQTRSACARHADAVLARLEVARIAGDSLHPALPQCRIAARLARWVEANLHRLPPDQRHRIDSLLTQLGQRFALPTERRLMQLAGDLPAELSEETLHALENALGPTEGVGATVSAVEEIGTLLILPAGTG